MRLLLLLLLPLAAQAGDVTLEWAPPTENVDGSPVTDLAGFRLFSRTEASAYASGLDIPDPAATSITVAVPERTYFVMTAYDADGHESAHSNEVCKEPNGATCGAPDTPGSASLVLSSWRFDPGPAYSCDCPSYELATLAVGARVYVDRAYTFTDVGPYAGRQFLRTANADKGRTPRIDVGSVLLAIDEREATVPVSGWTDTGNVIRTTDTAFNVYRGTGPIPSISFGSNRSNLFVIF